jgi:hypothetical protein
VDEAPVAGEEIAQAPASVEAPTPETPSNEDEQVSL